jgi:plastocyanin
VPRLLEGQRRRVLKRGPAAGCAVLLAAIVAGCGSSDEGPTNAEPSPKATVVMTDGAYRPARVRVEVGSRVTWVNRHDEGNTAETGGAGFFEFDVEKLDARNVFDIHTVQQGEAESVEFDTPGKYTYYSSLDSRMKGVVEVVPKGE